MTIAAIIPARGGSKGVPGKNIKLLAGKPLIGWTIEAAKHAPSLTRVIVNTDDDAIAEVARAFGAEIFKRPPELGEDLSDDLSVFKHHMSVLRERGELPDIVVDLRATAPLRGTGRIEEGIALLIQKGTTVDSVRAVSKAAKHPFKMWNLEGDILTPFLSREFTHMKEPYNAPRQALPAVYQNNGAMNALWSRTVLEKDSMTGEKIAGYCMEDWESINIDTEIDFLIAEEFIKKRFS